MIEYQADDPVFCKEVQDNKHCGLEGLFQMLLYIDRESVGANFNKKLYLKAQHNALDYLIRSKSHAERYRAYKRMAAETMQDAKQFKEKYVPNIRSVK